VKKAMTLALGILTSVGGFFDVGNIATSAQAGASFRFQLLWALLAGTLLVVFLVEMSGRFAAVSNKAFPDAIREHLGFRYWLVPFIVLVIVHLLVLATEIGGLAFAVHLVTGIETKWLAIPLGLLLWLFLWRTSFQAIENSTSFLGLVTLAFVVAAFLHHPPAAEVIAGTIPTLPTHDAARYWFIAVSIMGAVIAPYLFYFYSSGAVEDKWDESYVPVNRGVAVIGMGFGSVIAIGAVVVAAMVLAPRGIQMSDYHQAALMLTDALPFWGFVLFAASMGIACLGAATEVALSLAYTTAQTFGWNWGEDLNPRSDARFSLVYTAGSLVATLIIAVGVDPLKLTMLTMALNAAVLPFVVVPFLLLMNDRKLLGSNANGFVSNAVVLIVTVLAFVLAIVSIPLTILGGS
jgi:Mn2+/Fe2+ NRAMP family transporter